MPFGFRRERISLDVRSAESCGSLLAKTMERFGWIDILVNDAGVGRRPARVQETSEEEYDRVINVNVRGVSLATRAVVPVLLERGSRAPHQHLIHCRNQRAVHRLQTRDYGHRSGAGRGVGPGGITGPGSEYDRIGSPG